MTSGMLLVLRHYFEGKNLENVQRYLEDFGIYETSRIHFGHMRPEEEEWLVPLKNLCRFAWACHRSLLTENMLTPPKNALDMPERIVDYIRMRCVERGFERERLGLITINGDMTLYADHEVGDGTINGCHIDLPLIFKKIFLDDKVQFAIYHNHPGGVCEPSDGDVREAIRLNSAAKVLGINMLDFIIVTKTQYASLKQMDLI